jgi:type I restriction-modification system DNA methylase subunit
MSNNDEDLSSFLMDFGFTEDELFAVTYELDSYRSIPGTTVKRYLNRILQNITEEDRAAFLKGIMVGVVIRKAVDSMVEPELTEEEMRVAKEIERHRFSD